MRIESYACWKPNLMVHIESCTNNKSSDEVKKNKKKNNERKMPEETTLIDRYHWLVQEILRQRLPALLRNRCPFDKKLTNLGLGLLSCQSLKTPCLPDSRILEVPQTRLGNTIFSDTALFSLKICYRDRTSFSLESGKAQSSKRK